MPHSPKIDKLQKEGIVDSNKVTPEAQKVIDSLTDQELQAIVSVRKKIDPAKQPQYDNTIQILGF
jgi:hypothetical protein